MNFIPKIEDPKLVVVNSTMLASFDEEKCKGCGRFGCTDRGYTISFGDPPMVLGEEMLAQEVIENLIVLTSRGKGMVTAQNFLYNEKQCVRKLKKSNIVTLFEKMQACGEDCHRNCVFSTGGLMKARPKDYRCPFRNEEDSVCQRNVAMDGSPLLCFPNDEDLWDCEFHEEAYHRCNRRKEGQCGDLMEKYGVTGDKDQLVLLNHRFSMAPCRFMDDGLCSHSESQYYEGACSLKGLSETCEKYAPISSDQAYTEGVVAYVSSTDDKDDLRVFPSSTYARHLEPQQAQTLCTACRIVHSVAKLMKVKCLGVRRTKSMPFLNKETNPLSDYAIQLNYFYMSHRDDLTKYDPKKMALAVYLAMAFDCEGLQCEEYQSCKFNPI